MREKIFWNLFAKRYAKSPISNMEGYEHTLTLTKTFLTKKQTVLEIGCGTGTTALKLADCVKKYVATDIAPNMIAIGKEKALAQKVKNIEFHALTLFDDSLKENSFDVIMAYNLIHLLKNRDKVMQRIHQLLKPGGVFISKTPCLGEKFSMHLIAFFFRPLIGPIQCFTVEQFKESLKKAHFSLVKEHIYPESPPRAFIVAKK